MNETPAQREAREMREAFAELCTARSKRDRLELELRVAQREYDRQAALYRRRQLWARAEELRAELAKVEQEAADVHV